MGYTFQATAGKAASQVESTGVCVNRDAQGRGRHPADVAAPDKLQQSSSSQCDTVNMQLS